MSSSTGSSSSSSSSTSLCGYSGTQSSDEVDNTSSMSSQLSSSFSGSVCSSSASSVSSSSASSVSSSSCSRGRKRPQLRRQRRKSSRGNSSLSELAKDICVHRKRVLIITGAGVSVASGVKPFRGKSGVWTQVIWTTATRKAFRKDPLKWYNEFWLPFLELPDKPQPNAGHEALAKLLETFSNICMITQNVDGLHLESDRLIEAHGRLGLYKCMPADDSDTDSDSDDDDERAVHLGHRRKQRQSKSKCRYQRMQSLRASQLEPASARSILTSSSSYGSSSSSNSRPRRSSSNAIKCKPSVSGNGKNGNRGEQSLSETPRCPSCGNAVAPQALLFDEGYHSHDFYQFRRMEDWIESAEVIVFVGTSFAVTLTEVALDHARDCSLPVYNFNTQDFLESSIRLNVENVTGPSELTLPQLVEACEKLNHSGELGQRKRRNIADRSYDTTVERNRSRRRMGRKDRTGTDAPKGSIGVRCLS